MNINKLRPHPHAYSEKLVLFDYRLTCMTGLHIGAGKSADLASSNLPVMRDDRGLPFIPGFLLRGVLRAGIKIFSSSLRPESVLSRIEAAAADLPVGVAEGWEKLSLVDRLFGAVTNRAGVLSYGSRLQISDGLCIEEVDLELRNSITLNHEDRTAEQGAPLTFEVVPAGAQFLGRVWLKNPAAYELGLLAHALRMLDRGYLLLGGKVARGLGWVQVEATAPRQFDSFSIPLHEGSLAKDRKFGSLDERFSVPFRDLQQLIAETK